MHDGIAAKQDKRISASPHVPLWMLQPSSSLLEDLLCPRFRVYALRLALLFAPPCITTPFLFGTRPVLSLIITHTAYVSTAFTRPEPRLPSLYCIIVSTDSTPHVRAACRSHQMIPHKRRIARPRAPASPKPPSRPVTTCHDPHDTPSRPKGGAGPAPRCPVLVHHVVSRTPRTSPTYISKVSSCIPPPGPLRRGARPARLGDVQ